MSSKKKFILQSSKVQTKTLFKLACNTHTLTVNMLIMSFVTFMALSYAINKENYKAKVNILINTIKSIFSPNKLSVDSFQTKKWTTESSEVLKADRGENIEKNAKAAELEDPLFPEDEANSGKGRDH